MQFKYCSKDRLLIESIHSRLDKKQSKVRMALINYVLDNGKPFNINTNKVSELEVSDIDQQEFIKITEELKDILAIVVDEMGDVNFMYPVSALPTKHRVTLADGRHFCAMCAVDAMGSAFTFLQDIHIESECSQCGEPIKVDIKDGKILSITPKSTHILHVDLNKNKNWSGSC